MNLHVTAPRIELTREARDIIESRLAFAVDRFADRVRRVEVRVRDLNGPRGGLDMSCQVIVTQHRGGRVMVEAVDETVAAAVSKAADKLARRFEKQSRALRDERRRDERRAKTVLAAV